MHLLRSLSSTTVLLGVLAACDGDTRNCQVTERSSTSNEFDLSYQIHLPADCAVPLSNPGYEKKYAGGLVQDGNHVDMDLASIEVRNSAGKPVGAELGLFTGQANSRFVELRTEYTAATGTQTFSDHDDAIFKSYNSGFTKVAFGRVRITYRQSSLSTPISGERVPQPGSTHTWSAPVQGGYPAYMYQWYRDGSPVGTGSTYTGTVGASDTNLRVEVTDQTWSMVAAVLFLNVGGIEADVSGPRTVYASQGGGSWTASARGGSGAYTFSWYLDGVHAGNGIQWSGYPGENSHILEVRVQDSAGEFDSFSLPVTGIGGDSCEPVPPQLTC